MRHPVQPRAARLLRRRAGAALAVPAALGVLISAPAAGIAATGLPQAQDQAEAHASATPAPSTAPTGQPAAEVLETADPMAAGEARPQGITDPGDGDAGGGASGDAGGEAGSDAGAEGAAGEADPAPAGIEVHEQCTPSAVVNLPGGAPADGSVPAYLVGQALSIDARGWCSTPGTALEEPDITLTVHGPAGAVSYGTGYVLALVDSGEYAGVGGGDIDFEGLLDYARSLNPEEDIPSTGTFSLTFTTEGASVTTGLFTVSEPTPDPQPDPEPSPSTEPSPLPTGEPTAPPTAEPTQTPTEVPTEAPTTAPTPEPSAQPTAEPTTVPTTVPTAEPTTVPSTGPSAEPTGEPTASPSATPSTAPSTAPTTPPVPTCVPTAATLALVGAQEGQEPAYRPQDTITFAGHGWCSPEGGLEEGSHEVTLQMGGRGGYGSEKVIVPVDFSQGAFRVELPEQLRRSAEQSTAEAFYLQVSYGGHTAGSGYFTLVKGAPVDPPTTPPTAPPSTEPTPEPSAVPTTPPATEPPTAPLATSTQGAEPTTGSPMPVEPEPTSQAPDPQDPQAQPAPPDDSAQAQREEPAASAQPAPIGRPTPQAVLEAEDPATRDTGATAADQAGEPNEAGAAAQATAQSSAAVDPKERPTATPQAPVTSASELSAENAGSLSGARQGNLVTLILPSSAVSQGEWVSVFVFPGGQSPGWVQVDGSNSVAIDISTLNSGSYELVVANRDNLLLGWARLEIAEASYAPGEVRQARVLPGAQAPVGPGYIGPDDWLLIGAGGLLVLGAASFLVAARSGVAAIRG